MGEHHRSDYAVSAHSVVLGTVAAVTRRIRLTSAVTILSSADPVRLFEEFATLDLLSGGRAELMAGRGAFTESFPLFGHDLRDYDSLYEEKLKLLLQLNREDRISWRGRHRAALHDAEVAPLDLQLCPTWLVRGPASGLAVVGLVGV